MKNRLKEIRKTKGLTQSELADACGTSLRNIQFIEKGERGIEPWMEALSRALGVPQWQLVADAGEFPRAPSNKGGLSDGHTSAPPPKIPVWGVVDAQDGERYAINTEDTPIEFIDPLPVQETDKDAFGLLVAGDSMFPKYEPGMIVCVHSSKKPIKGKDCVIEMKDGTGLLKKYVGMQGDEYAFEQLNPPKKFTLKKAEIQKIMPVVGVIYEK